MNFYIFFNKNVQKKNASNKWRGPKKRNQNAIKRKMGFFLFVGTFYGKSLTCKVYSAQQLMSTFQASYGMAGSNSAFFL